MKNEEQTRTLFGINLTSKPIWQQFFICSSGFFFGYLVNGICGFFFFSALFFQEYVYNRLQFSYGWYFTFVQGFVYLILLRLQGFTTKHMVNPWKTYWKLSAILMGSHGLTKGSLAWLNYPAQLIRKHLPHEYIAVILLVIRLIMFTLADANTSPNFSMLCVIMVSGALIMDAFLGNLQEAIFTMNPETSQGIVVGSMTGICYMYYASGRNTSLEMCVSN
ncbi:hypothetical protein MKX01_001894 [Papaver californicum]|nr:hypothetical protein MKX01_001894 [Papaver californicum]